MQEIDPDPLLGQALANYPSDRLRPLIIAGVIGAPIALALGLTTAQVLDWWGPVLTVILMALVVLALGWYVLHFWNREIILYEQGFSYREGSKTIFFMYAEITSIRLRAEQLAYFGGLLRRTIYRFTVNTREDERFTITDLYRRADELGTRLTERINRTLQPEIARRLAADETIPFGDTLALSSAGLREGGRELAWADYGGQRIGGRKLTLFDRSGAIWYAVPLSEVDNITLLLDILRERAPQKN
jgi:uncharacterized membrane protein YobD (UPF0266 family)